MLGEAQRIFTRLHTVLHARLPSSQRFSKYRRAQKGQTYLRLNQFAAHVIDIALERQELFLQLGILLLQTLPAGVNHKGTESGKEGG